MTAFLDRFLRFFFRRKLRKEVIGIMEATFIDIEKVLIGQVKKKGVEAECIPRFIKDLIHSFAINPSISLSEVVNRMHSLGWDEAEVDYHTLELARASFDWKQSGAEI